MFIALLIVHIFVSLLLVLVVLVQTGRGAELGAAFGGVGQATYGRTQGNFLTKFTTGVAVIFMSTSLALAFISSEQPTRSVIAAPEPVASEATRQSGSAAQPAPGEQTEEAAAPSSQPLRQTKAPPKANPEPPKSQ